MNIPIYRAFSNVFDKNILGAPYFDDGQYYMLVDSCNANSEIGTGSFPIDETTLSIHFPDMLDSKGNKIFASLSEDGKGGDIVDLPSPLKADKDKTRKAYIIAKSFNQYKAVAENGAEYGSGWFIKVSKVIGIQD